MLYETFRLALDAIRRHALRSFLTVLGIVIGVAAVIALVTIGNGTTAKVSEELSKLGANVLFVRPGQFGPGRASADARPFNVRDIEAIDSQIRGIRAVAPIAQKAVTVVYGSESRSTIVTGTDNNYFTVQNWLLAGGRPVSRRRGARRPRGLRGRRNRAQQAVWRQRSDRPQHSPE
jgi:putative ABC transport system permease protein